MHQSVFHYSFGSKKELLQELIRTIVGGMVDAAVLVSEVTPEPRESIRGGLQRLWNQAREHPDLQLIGYELTTYALRDPELRDLATWQYEEYFAASQRFIATIESVAQVEWTLPRPVLGRMLATVADGLILGWLADRNDEAVDASFAAFADYFSSLAVPRTA